MKTGAKIITIAEATTLRKSLPVSWSKAIGLLKGKGIDPIKYQRAIRKEWDQRSKQQLRVTRHGH